MRSGGPGRAAVGVLALALVIANAVTVLTPASVHTAADIAPVRALDELFLTGHMFTTDLPENLDVVIEGRWSGAWHPLPLGEIFVSDVPGDRVARLYAVRARFLHGERAQRAAWDELAARIARSHRRRHPTEPIDAVRFGVDRWPKDPAGYEARRRPGEVRRTFFFVRELR